VATSRSNTSMRSPGEAFCHPRRGPRERSTSSPGHPHPARPGSFSAPPSPTGDPQHTPRPAHGLRSRRCHKRFAIRRSPVFYPRRPSPSPTCATCSAPMNTNLAYPVLTTQPW
jgi:hypothetical protein